MSVHISSALCPLAAGFVVFVLVFCLFLLLFFVCLLACLPVVFKGGEERKTKYHLKDIHW